jgi:hypothetical protein
VHAVNPEARKEPYQKPKLTTIELKAEEVLAVGCKSAMQGGQQPGSCIAPGPCVKPGS